MPTIYLSVNGNSTNLRVRDSEGNNPGNDNVTTLVNTNDTITWEPDPNPPPGANAIANLVSVYRKNLPNNGNLLTGVPSPNGNGGLSATVVSSSPGRGVQESYGVEYQVVANGSSLYDDPKLQMNG
ncbi:MAG: hypothetical protein HYX40_12740 [Sphingobacteriales bacterium]|nr:hypothetical protein [Sphingobacteriales bacterium]